MRMNYETCLSGAKCVLVPYRPEHVGTYHEWMQDPHLLEMTGSEPLSYEEEVQMQQSWRDDENKVTFIILDRSECKGGVLDSAGGDDPHFVRNNLGAMVGDVNLFLSEEEADAEGDAVDGVNASPRPRQAELDIMIAVERCRGRGMGAEASRMMMLYGAEQLGIRRFFAKIKEENAASRKLFRSTLGFEECNFVECFREHEFEFREDSAEQMAITLRGMLESSITTWRCALPPARSDNCDNE